VTPFVFDILVHYYVSVGPYDRNRNPSAIEAAEKYLVGAGLLEAAAPYDQENFKSKYKATDKGAFWIDAVLNTPLPVPKWVIPEDEK